MHLYWRIQQDLNCLGELLVFHDPSFRRAMRRWIERNAGAIALAELGDLTGVPLTGPN